MRPLRGVGLLRLPERLDVGEPLLEDRRVLRGVLRFRAVDRGTQRGERGRQRLHHLAERLFVGRHRRRQALGEIDELVRNH